MPPDSMDNTIINKSLFKVESDVHGQLEKEYAARCKEARVLTVHITAAAAYAVKEKTTICQAANCLDVVRYQKHLYEKFKVETRIIAVDFASEDIYDKIKTRLAGLEIGILVNNVGMSYEYPEYFLDLPDLDNTIKKLINVNVLSVCKMTQLVLPNMVERSKGVILNISSASGMFAVPLLTIYSATKAFVDFFSRCLHEEYRSKGIFVQCVLPYYVATKLAKIRKPTLDKPSAETFVKSAIKTVGLQSRTNGYPIHFLLALVTSLVPPGINRKIIMDFNKSVRARYLKKFKKN
ncbi:PREDICTED: estradiol 17-beta-dehydrogenase 12 [Galeopterus variegatus]|uniref:Very-long-chain 3-oxoacyl-CoA reductase n=1 Tax=Galeopterus variegatus TaxID=482537 RepID=A0ABM0RYD4_GALVR|nr:PREDICTED: estradiol 17-beta-dehydrogenase 12 [Galeopterus variegatus]